MQKLATDPVCGMKGDEEDGDLNYNYGRIRYSFCSWGCLDAFKASPEKYLDGKNSAKPEQIRPSVYWVGAVDPSVKRPINSFLIVDKKSVLIYNSTGALRPETMAKVYSIIDPLSIDYLISTTSVFGNCCGLRNVARNSKKTKLFTSSNTKDLELLELLGGCDLDRHIGVRGRQELDLGNRALTLFPSPLSGGYDAMYVYDDAEKILFSGDLLSNRCSRWNKGSIPASSMTESLLKHQELKFPWLRLASKDKVRQEISKMPIKGKIEVIAPSEGTILDGNPDRYFDALVKLCD